MKIRYLLAALLLAPSLATPPYRSSALERCLYDGPRPERMRRADVDLW